MHSVVMCFAFVSTVINNYSQSFVENVFVTKSGPVCQITGDQYIFVICLSIKVQKLAPKGMISIFTFIILAVDNNTKIRVFELLCLYIHVCVAGKARQYL